MLSNVPLNKKTIYTGLAGIGLGIVTSIMNHKANQTGKSSLLGSVISAAPGALATFVGGKTLGLGGNLGAKLAAAYVAGKAAKENVTESGRGFTTEARRRGGDAYDVLRGRRHEPEDQGSGADSLLLAVALVGLGAGAAYLLDPTRGAERRRQLRDAVTNTLGDAGQTVTDAAASAKDQATEFVTAATDRDDTKSD
jgi:hypothetical protein